jgi:hypothetical protein
MLIILTACHNDEKSIGTKCIKIIKESPEEIFVERKWEKIKNPFVSESSLITTYAPFGVERINVATSEGYTCFQYAIHENYPYVYTSEKWVIINAGVEKTYNSIEEIPSTIYFE